MKKLGLIGYPLGHSFSKGYFAKKFRELGIDDFTYDNYPIESMELLPELIVKEPDLIGLNVTIPYKQVVMDYLDEIDDAALQIGAVNTLKISRSESGSGYKLKGFNTDAYGFEKPLLEKAQTLPKSALILGTGGASKAVSWVLKKHGIHVVHVSRNPKNTGDISYDQLSENIINDYKIIVNCSPVGMHPNNDSVPDIPYNGIGSEHILYDLIYNPEETMFLKYGKNKKATTLNGLPMLFYQADKAWEIWARD